MQDFTLDLIAEISVFFLGACIGSFLNVLIFRLPRKISIILPSSFCPYCRRKIRWFDNIPLLSFLILGGKCRFCKKPISLRYFFVELLTACLFVFLFKKFKFSSTFIVMCIFSSLLIVASFTDLEHRIIPDEISLGGILLGLILSIIFPWIHKGIGWSYLNVHMRAFLESVIGAITGAGLLYITGWIGSIIFKKEAMGGGDVKLLALIGSFWGPKIALFSFLFAPFLGSIAGIIHKLKTGQSTIPYGPFLAIGGFLGVFVAEEFFYIIWGVR